MRKKIRFSVLLIFVIILTTIFTGCVSDKKPVAGTMFMNTATEMGFKYQDITDQYEDAPHVKQCIVAINSNESRIEFFEIEDNSKASQVFASNKNMIDKSLEGTTSSSSITFSNYQSYTISDSSSLYIVVRVENTVIYSKTSKGNENDIRDFIKGINY